MAKKRNKDEPKRGRGRPKSFETVEQLQDTIERYKQYLKEDKKPPTIAGLAYYTGIDRTTLYTYKEKDEYYNIIKKFVDWILMEYEETAIQKGGAGIIFLMKNYGYSDKCEMAVTGIASLEAQLKDMQGDEF